MTTVGACGETPPRAPRAALFTAIVVGHLLIIMVLLGSNAREPARAETPPLFVFYVPPPNPETRSTPPPSRLPPKARAADDRSAGGLPGERRQRPSAQPAVAIPRREAMEATFSTAAPSLPMAGLQAGDGAVDLGGAGGPRGLGTGTGLGIGSGDGLGGPAFLRADWIRRPDDDDWHRSWPRRNGTLVARSALVELECFVRRNGSPHKCKLVEVTSGPREFGRAAVRLLTNSRLRPVRRNGDDVRDLPVRVSIAFDWKQPSS